MVQLPDSVYEDSGLDTPDSSGGSSGGGSSSGGGGGGGGGGSASVTSTPAPGSDAFDEMAQDTVTENMADQGFVADEDLTSGSGGGATRSPDAGSDFTELGEDVSDSPEVTVEEDLGGRFTGNVFDQLREHGTAVVDTSEAGNRSAAAADAVAYGNEVAGATFEALPTDALSGVEQLREQVPMPELPESVGGDDGGGLLLAAAAVVATLLIGGGAAVMED